MATLINRGETEGLLSIDTLSLTLITGVHILIKIYKILKLTWIKARMAAFILDLLWCRCTDDILFLCTGDLMFSVTTHGLLLVQG